MGAGVVTSESLDATIACRAYRAGAQTIEVGTEKVLLETENFDVGSDFDTGNSRFVVPVTGYYQVNVQIGITDLDALGNQALAYIYVNGAAVSQFRSYSVAAGGDPQAAGSDLVYAVAGQYIELYVQNSSAATESLQTGSTISYMSIYFVGV